MTGTSTDTAKVIRSIRHWLAHRLGWYTGQVYVWRCPYTDKIMVGFQCGTCGEVSSGNEA